jgi:hypothetical protein
LFKRRASYLFAVASPGGGGDPKYLPSQISASKSVGSLFLRLPLRRQEEKGTLFLCLVVRVRVCLLWCNVGVAGAVARRINLPHLHSHTGDDLHGGVSQVMATCADRFFKSAD